MLNQVQLIGNIGRNPNFTTTDAGHAKATFSLATNETWKDSNGDRQEHTEWHRLVAWRKLAEIVRDFLSKGDRIFVQGKLRTSTWTDEHGVQRSRTEIVVQDLRFLEVKGKGERDSGRTEPDGPTVPTDAPDGDIPF